MLQIEHKLAVSNLEEILTVPGVDALFVGPSDLSGSMNLLGQVGHENVQSAIREVRQKCLAAGMPYGIFGMTAEACGKELAAGAALVCMGLDAMHLYNGACSELKVLGTLYFKL